MGGKRKAILIKVLLLVWLQERKCCSLIRSHLFQVIVPNGILNGGKARIVKEVSIFSLHNTNGIII